MGVAYFYHLTRHPLDQTLSGLLNKARGVGWRIAVRAKDAERLAWLDERLWMGPEDGFLAHGLQGGAHDALQPVLLTIGAGEVANSPQCIMCIDGADVTSQEVEQSERVCILFDGTDPDAVQQAREQWKGLTQAKCSAQYWSEESGRWEMKAKA
jgi:DNA polymerase III subunit chi